MANILVHKESQQDISFRENVFSVQNKQSGVLRLAVEYSIKQVEREPDNHTGATVGLVAKGGVMSYDVFKEAIMTINGQFQNLIFILKLKYIGNF
jgi:hypothetical protein